ncbi:MAG: antitoxin VapB family protein [Candidatus Thorarchaeota archaeon]|nr:antitoxin VapB family protein [Candidatus Thorarchaeota archaeon]
MTPDIMIDDEIYARLKAMKRVGESFDVLILRLINQRRKTSMLDLAGTWPYSKKKMKEQEEMLRTSWRMGSRN